MRSSTSLPDCDVGRPEMAWDQIDPGVAALIASAEEPAALAPHRDAVIVKENVSRGENEGVGEEEA